VVKCTDGTVEAFETKKAADAFLDHWMLAPMLGKKTPDKQYMLGKEMSEFENYKGSKCPACGGWKQPGSDMCSGCVSLVTKEGELVTKKSEYTLDNLVKNFGHLSTAGLFKCEECSPGGTYKCPKHAPVYGAVWTKEDGAPVKTVMVKKIEVAKPAWPAERSFGKLTFANVDSPDDRWIWAIVTGYQGCQDYGDIVCAFDADYMPSEDSLLLMLVSLNAALFAN
jgi:hypothetical protein